MTAQFTPEDLEAQMAVKDVFDPDWLLNPAKVFPLAPHPRAAAATAAMSHHETPGWRGRELPRLRARGCERIGAPLEIRGGRHRAAIGRPVATRWRRSRSRAQRHHALRAGRADAGGRAGTPMAEIEAALAAEGQRLAFEPMDHRTLLGHFGQRPPSAAVVACQPRAAAAGAGGGAAATA